MVSLSPIGALGCLVRLALAAALSAVFHSIAVPSTAQAQASEPPAESDAIGPTSAGVIFLNVPLPLL